MCILEHQSPNGLLKFRFFHLHLRKQNKIKQQHPPFKLQIQTPSLEAAQSLAGFLLVFEDFFHFMPLSLCRHRHPCPESLVLSPADHFVVQNPIPASVHSSSKPPTPFNFCIPHSNYSSICLSSLPLVYMSQERTMSLPLCYLDNASYMVGKWMYK